MSSTTLGLQESSRFFFYFVLTCIVIRKAAGFFGWRGVMSESCCWLFVENVPLLFDKERVQRQLKVESWLDLTQLLKEIKDEDKDKKSHQQPINYVV